MQNTKQKSHVFCLEILTSKIRRRSGTCNLLMALASYQDARSPTELSESPLFHHEYGSITKVLSNLARDAEERAQVLSLIQSHTWSHYKSVSVPVERVRLQTDTTPYAKPHSPTLAERTYIHLPNKVIRSDSGLSIGYDVSCINLSAEDKWSLPLSTQRVLPNETATQCALAQLKGLFEHKDLGFLEKLVVNTLDSKYGNAAYLASAFGHDSLVNVVRGRYGNKVWTSDPEDDTGGAPRIYGEKFYLLNESRTKTYKHPKTKQPHEVYQRAITELDAQQSIQLKGQTKKGRALDIHIDRYEDMRLRTKNGHDMKDKPLDVLHIRVLDAQTQKALYKRDMFVFISGKRKNEVTTQEGYEDYRHRYDIEPYFRFAKQRLMYDKLQSSNVDHIDNWLFLQQWVAWLLYVASDEATFKPKKWRQYSNENKNIQPQDRLSMAQTHKATQTLFLTFDDEPFKPLKSKKGKPRQEGQTQTPKIRYPVVKKQT